MMDTVETEDEFRVNGFIRAVRRILSFRSNLSSDTIHLFENDVRDAVGGFAHSHCQHMGTVLNERKHCKPCADEMISKVFDAS